MQNVTIKQDTNSPYAGKSGEVMSTFTCEDGTILYNIQFEDGEYRFMFANEIEAAR